MIYKLIGKYTGTTYTEQKSEGLAFQWLQRTYKTHKNSKHKDRYGRRKLLPEPMEMRKEE